MSSLHFLYKTAVGRILLKPLICPAVTRLSGAFLDTGFSKCLIKSFVRNNNINTDEYQLDGIRCFNDFFARRIKEGFRPVDTAPDALIAPCDGLLTAYGINKDTVIPVKQSTYSISSLLEDSELAKEFEGGMCLVYRLCVDHYHRYGYVDSGAKSEGRKLKGVFHTVRPIALEEYPVFIRNQREYCAITSPVFGKMVQMEVGAMLVGKIVNDENGVRDVVRGAEKGHFEYGGSTIIVLIRKDAARINEAILKASASGEETPVRLGEKVGTAVS